RRQKTVVIPKAVAYAISELLEEKDEVLDHLKIQLNNREIILDNIHDGMIVINDQGIVQFVNKRAEEIDGNSKIQFEQKNIKKNTLTQCNHSREKSNNQKLHLESGKNKITDRMPMINADDQLIGAFAVFKDITEVVYLAEENKD